MALGAAGLFSNRKCLLFIRQFLLKHILRRLCVGIVLATHVSKYFLSTQLATEA